MTTEAPTLPQVCYPDDKAAAAALGVSVTTLWRRCSLPERDPRRIRRTSYGKIPVEELQRHVRAELNH